MKSIIIFIILSLNIFSVQLLYSQDPDCPAGFDEKVVPITVGAFVYNVRICYKCSPDDPPDIRVFGFTKITPGQPPETYNEIFEQICNQVFHPDFIASELCSDPIHPCGSDDWIYITKTYYKCWNKSNNSGTIRFLPCLTNWNCICTYVVRLCWDSGTNQYLQEDYYGPELVCTIPCPDIEEYQVPDPLPGETSECFYLWTPCND